MDMLMLAILAGNFFVLWLLVLWCASSAPRTDNDSTPHSGDHGA